MVPMSTQIASTRHEKWRSRLTGRFVSAYYAKRHPEAVKSFAHEPEKNQKKGIWFVKLSLVEELSGSNLAMAHNLNMTYEAEDEIDAINQALRCAFDEAHKDGNTLSSIHVGHPRYEDAK
jgi:hypothetical protein